MPQVPANPAALNDRFLAALLRGFLQADLLPPRWTVQHMRAECRRLGVAA